MAGMPAEQTIDYGGRGWVEISIEPVDKPKSVYFTDENPAFILVFRNMTDLEVRTDEGKAGVRWVLELGARNQKQLATGDIHLTLEPEDVRRERIEPGLLAYDGTAVLGVSGFSVSEGYGKDDTGPIVIYAQGDPIPLAQVLYTFPVWDRDFYEAVYEHPKHLQRYVIGLAFITAVLAALQFWVIFTG